MNRFMKSAINQALKARDLDEVPIGAVIVQNGKIIAKAHNLMEKTQIATAHAEVLAINKACKKLKSWRLDGAEMYVTIEPCPMCAGAIINSRISRVFYGAYDNKWGSFGSLIDLSAVKYQTVPEIHGGIMEAECKRIVEDFFKKLRK